MTLEHIVTPPGTDPVDPPEYSWEEVVVGINGVDPLSGFRFSSRAYVETPPGPRVYVPWTLIEQTVTPSLPDMGTELFTAPPGDYSSAVPAEGGIVDGTGYTYTRVFTKADFWYLPAFSGGYRDGFTGEIEAEDGNFPDEPYDPDNNIYPLDAVTRFHPDDRESVVVSYEVTTRYIMTGVELTDTMTIYQEVRQPNNNWGALLRSLIRKTYFANKIYH